MATVIHHFDSFEEALQGSLELSYSLSEALKGATDFDSVVSIAAENIFGCPEGQPRPSMAVDLGLFSYQTTSGVQLTVRQVADSEWYARIEAPATRRPSSLAAAARAAGWDVLPEQDPDVDLGFDPSRFYIGEKIDDEQC